MLNQTSLADESDQMQKWMSDFTGIRLGIPFQ